MQVAQLVWMCAALALTTLQPAPKPNPTPSKPPEPVAPPSEAEKIARLRQTITDGTQTVEKMGQRLDDPNGEYAVAEAEFQQLDKKLRDAREEIRRLKMEGQAAEAGKREAGLKPLQEEWEHARARFDVAIRQRKATQEAMAALKTRLEREQKQLDKLEGKTPPAPTAEKPPAPAPTTSTPQTPAPTPTEAPKPAAVTPASAVMPGLPTAATQPPPTPASEASKPPEPEDPAVKQAREQLEARRTALKESEEKVTSASERVEALERTIRAAEQVLEAERMAADQAQQTLTRLTDKLRTQPPADPAERRALADKAADAGRRLADSRERVEQITAKLGSLNEDLHALRQEQMAALQEAETRKIEAEAAGEELAEVVNPFTARNLARWAADHGPNLLGIVAAVLALYLLVRQFSRQVIRVVVRHSYRGSEEDRENRASTLVGVFRYAASVLILGGGVVMLLDEAGVPVVPLMGGAAVIGLAVAFGAQNLIKDYFSGFMILMEDQYGVNDVVKIGSIAGLVERITLRVTALRDLEGTLHFVPHGSITTVSNMTHTWSRALIDVPVPHDADPERVMGVLTDLGRELRRDPLFGLKITDDPEMLGVETLDHSAVVVRFLLKTRPLQQWAVKREMLRRIKKRFDELGIAIPYPHRTVVHKFPDGMPATGTPAAAGEGSRLWAA